MKTNKARTRAASVAVALILASVSVCAKEVKLRVTLYPSITIGSKEERVVAATKPFVDWLSNQIDRPVELVVQRKGETAQDLERFGRMLNNTEGELGVIWGIELGWLKRRLTDPHNALVPLATVSFGEEVAMKSQLMTSSQIGLQGLEQLRGKRLAIYKTMPLADRLFLLKLLAEKKTQPDTFFGQITEYSTTKAAFLAVYKQEADCVVLGAMAFSRLVANQPNITLNTLAKSAENPAPVIVGNRERLEQLDNGLWDRLQRELVDSHSNPYGNECFKFWMFQKLLTPDNRFEQLTKNSLTQYPIDMLRDLPSIRHQSP